MFIETENPEVAQKNRLFNWYFEPAPWESEKLYELLGIKLFKRFLPTSGDFVSRKFFNPFDRTFIHVQGHSSDSLKKFDNFTKVIEGLHFGFRIPIFLIVGSYVASGGSDPSIIGAFTGLDVVANEYPIMLQRYNRIRLRRAQSRRNSLDYSQ